MTAAEKGSGGRRPPGSTDAGRLLAVGLSLLLLGGCALLGRGREDDAFGPGDRDGPVALEIQNDNFKDARIYARWNGDRRRIGMVTGKTSESFELAWRSNDLRVEVDFIAGGGFVTDAMAVWPGERVHLWIPATP
jgi:hypothetical protein